MPLRRIDALFEIERAINGKSIEERLAARRTLRRSDKALADLARMFTPYIHGWINYFGHFYRSALVPLKSVSSRFFLVD